MHELSITQSIVDIAVKNCIDNGYRLIKKIYISIGAASGVMPDSLYFAFDIIKKDTIAENAELCINLIPIRGVCKQCSKEFNSHSGTYIFNCPLCNSEAITVTGGFELELSDIEVE